MASAKQISIVIPAYNEEKFIQPVLEEVAAYFEKNNYDYELLVVDDGSKDQTVKKVENVALRYPRIHLIKMSQNQGKGEAIKKGVLQSSKAVCLFMDADNSTRIEEWAKFEKCFEEGAKAVIASRHIAGSHIVHQQPFVRRFLGTGYRVLCRTLFGLRVSDFNCGFKAFESSLAKRIFAEIKMKDWTFDVETFCRLKKEKVEICEVPVTWKHFDKTSHLPPFKTAWRSLKSIVRLKRLIS